MLIGLGSASVASAAFYFGIIKPNVDSGKVHTVLGSTPIMDKRRVPYEVEGINDNFYVKDFAKVRSLPSVYPRLVVDHLKKETKNKYSNAFHPTVASFTKEDPTFKTYFDTNWHWSKSDMLRLSESVAASDKSFSIITDREITYNSTFFALEIINSFTKDKIGNDLLWSLAEEAEFNNNVIRPDSIRIEFTTEKPSMMPTASSLNNFFPVPALKVNGFVLKFRVFNPNHRKTTVLRSIELNPNVEANVTVRIARSELRPLAQPVRSTGNKAVSWALIPIENNLFEIEVDTLFPFAGKKVYSQKELSLMHGRSKFIDRFISKDHNVTPDKLKSLNLPTYSNLKNIVDPNLIGITRDQIKKDIETWFGPMAVRYARMMVEDVIQLTNILKAKILIDSKGNPASLMDQFEKSIDWRTNFYNHIRFDKGLRQFIDGFFDEASEQKITSEELGVLLSSVSKDLNDIKDKINISFKWLEEPSLGNPLPTDNSPFPTVNFKFEQKYSWDKEIKINFKGCWDTSTKSRGEEEKSSCSGGNKKHFDFSNKLSKLKDILSPLNIFPASGADFLGKLIPDAAKFIGWNSWSFGASDNIKFQYSSKNSPIRPAISSSTDAYDRLSPNIVLGWKALDVTVDYDLTNFTKFFYEIYEKIDVYEEQGTTVNLQFVQQLQNKFKESPISLIAFLVNKLFKDEKDKNSSDENKRPWPVFFKSLFSQNLKVASDQLFVGFSRAFFTVEDWLLNETKDTSTSTSSTSSKQSSSGGQEEVKYKSSYYWKEKKPEYDLKFPAKPKSERIKEIIETLHIYWSTYFPHNPMTFPSPTLFSGATIDSHYKNFFDREGATSVGLINHADKLKSLLRGSFQHDTAEQRDSAIKNTFFPAERFVNWDGVKLSFTRMEIVKALKSILALKNNWASIKSSIAGVLSSVLTTFTGDIDIPNILGQAIQRDMFMVNVNMMMGDGSINVIQKYIYTITTSYKSTNRFFVEPKFDHKKLELGPLKSYIK